MTAIISIFFCLSAAQANTQVVAWGNSANGLTNPPSSLTNIVMLAAGSAHAVALRNDGTVTAWGLNSSGQTNIPASATNIVAIAAGGSHTLALRRDGTVMAWGLNSSGQTNVPASLSNVVAIAAGNVHSVALKANGTVLAWGSNGAGQTNIPAGLSNVVAISAGYGQTLAVKADGSVAIWGSYFNANIFSYFPLTSLPVLTNAVVASGGMYHGLALKPDGKLVSWGGSSTYGLTNVPSSLTNASFKAIVSSDNDNFLLSGNGTVTAWGNNSFHMTNIPSILTNVSMLAAGGNTCYALIGDGPPFVTTPLLDRTVNGGSSIWLRAIASGASPLSYQWQFNGNPISGETNQALTMNNVSLAQAGAYSVIISNSFGTVSNGCNITVASLAITTQPQGQSTYKGAPVTFSISASGLAPISYQWLFNGSAIDGAVGTNLVLTNVQISQAGTYSIAVGNSVTNLVSSNAVLSVGMVVGWGLNNHGQTNLPPGLTNVIAVATGYQHSLALNGDGTVVGWGNPTSYDACGQEKVPTDLSNVVAIAAGSDHSLALKNDGTVVAWGAGTNNSGYTGSFPFYGQCMIPDGLSNVVGISACQFNSVALQNDGTVVVWGYTNYNLNTVPPGLSNVIAIAGGSMNIMALQSNGAVVAWGDNFFGQTNVPTDLTNVVAVTMGASHGLALKNDGTVVAWGDNEFSQLAVPPGLSNVVAIKAAGYHSVALKSDGTVVAWGSDPHGEVDVPAALTNIGAIGTKFYHSLVVIGSGPLGEYPAGRYPMPLAPQKVGSVFSIPVQTQSGSVYRLEYKNSLNQTNWTPFVSIAGTGTTQILTDVGATGIQRYYRVRQW